jgi:hypothetical protein
MANIRYIGGWCVQNLVTAKRKVVLKNLYLPHKEDIVKDFTSDIRTLADLCTTERDDQDVTAAVVLRKEYTPGSLKLVSHHVLHVFVQIDKLIAAEESVANTAKYGKGLYNHILDVLFEDQSLISLWMPISTNVMLLHELIEKYVILAASHFVKQYKEKHGVKKRFAHRTQVAVGGSKKPRTSIPEYPCGECAKECVTNCVFCETCKKWFHYRCIGLRGNEPQLASEAPDWKCNNCSV